MATKDWKQTYKSSKKDVNQNKKTREILSIEDWGKSPSGYRYLVLRGKNNSYNTISKWFKTKTEAMRYAKAYMAKH